MTKAKDMIRLFAGTTAAALVLMAICSPASAQQFEDIGDYRVHYSAMNTRMLPPEVAGAYDIQRSGNRAMINIAVLRKAESEGEMDTPVRADVSASAVNLTGQQRDIDVREIADDGAVYYIGSFRIANEETLNFTIEVQPEGNSEPAETFTFKQKFYSEE